LSLGYAAKLYVLEVMINCEVLVSSSLLQNRSTSTSICANYRIVTRSRALCRSCISLYHISSTLTIMDVILVASLAVLAVPKIAICAHWLGGLENVGPPSPSTVHHTLIGSTTYPNACHQSLGIELKRLKQGRMRIHQAYHHNVKFCVTKSSVLNSFEDTYHQLFVMLA